MEKPDVFMPIYIGDYLGGTSRLTTELHGAYLLLIFDYWMNGPPPDNDVILSSITRMTPDAWSIARASLKHYFSITNGVWEHKRIEEELTKAYDKKRKSKAKAEKAAAVRWGNEQKTTKDDAWSIGQALLEECPSPSPSPSHKGQGEDGQVEYKKIIDLYNDLLGNNLRQVRDITSKRRSAIKARITDDKKRKDIGWWEKYFIYVRDQNPHLIGGSPAREAGGQPWKADFDWLVNQTNMTKVIERKYEQLS